MGGVRMTAREHLERGDRFLPLQNYEKAVKEYRLALELDPLLAEAHVRIAGIYQINGDPQAALTEQAMAINIAPLWVDLYGSSADILAQLGRYDEAEVYYLQAISLAPSDSRLPLGLGQCYYHMKRYDDAIRWYREALMLDCSVGNRLFLAEAYHANGMTSEAITEWTVVANRRCRSGDDRQARHLAQKMLDKQMPQS